MKWLRSPSNLGACTLLFSLTVTIGGCFGPMQFENAGSPNTLEQDRYDCEIIVNSGPFAHAYARDPMGNMGYPYVARKEMQRCLERKGWRLTEGESQAKKSDAVTGPNPRTGQSQLQKREKSLTGLEGRKGTLYERQLEGDKVLAKSSEKLEKERTRAEEQKAILESIYEDITLRGHDIMIGEPEVDALKEMVNLSFPVVIKSNPIINSKIHDLNRSQFGKELTYGTYKNFEQRLEQVYFTLELVLAGGEFLACHAPKNLTKYETDGEFLSVDDKPSAWNIRISAPLQTTKRMTSVRGGFVEGAHGSVCGVTRNSK